MPEHHSVVVVGSGFAGLGMAVALKREGIEDFAPTSAPTRSARPLRREG